MGAEVVGVTVGVTVGVEVVSVAVGMAVVNGVPMPVSGTAATISVHCQRWVRITRAGRRRKTLLIGSPRLQV